MRAILAGLLLLTALSGCSDDGDGFFEEKARGPPAQDPTNTTVQPGTQTVGEPVSITDSGDMLSGVDAEWTWDVFSNASRFDVKVLVEGLEGAPFQTTLGLMATLSGGLGNRTVFLEQGSSGNSISFGNSGDCLLCYDGVAEAGPSGPWRLHLFSQAGAASYKISVDVQY